MFEFFAQILDMFYGIVPSYAVAIILLTLLVMVITTPLTMRGTRGMIKMQFIQPELKKLNDQKKAGKLTQEEFAVQTQALMMEHGVNPLGGCIPMLAQMPAFLILFQLLKGLTSRDELGFFVPKYLDEGSGLYQALHGSKEMLSFGIDLSTSTRDALADSVLGGMPYLILILAMVGAQYLSQKQVSARSNGDAMPQQQVLLKIMPVFFGFMSLNFSAALVVYWVTSSVYRIGLQYYITRTLYHGEDSLGARARAVTEQHKADQKATGGKSSATTGAAGSSGSDAAARTKPRNDNGSSTPMSSKRVAPQSRSKKKKKRR